MFSTFRVCSNTWNQELKYYCAGIDEDIVSVSVSVFEVAIVYQGTDIVFEWSKYNFVGFSLYIKYEAN